ncbi:DEAD/DEAH box helicase [Patescibacteria group bacterium]|nr:DEAD/DEAH box helicase [Patescibacteria group bacterium]MBU1672973.1 DEAD/DEAH box helicase [Patescibacteria group bacterium]MBU1962992.1 DEAD/DEAH box helicase [Patescibacteria group bacterium]
MSIWRNPTEIGYELSTTPLLFKEEGAFYLAKDNREAELLKKICLFWNKNFPTELILSPAVLKEQKVSQADYEKKLIHLSIGQDMPPQDIIAKLTDLNFEKDKTANRPKTFARRGELLDVYINEPTRFEFFGNKIDKIYTFDLKGKKQKELESVGIKPELIPESATILSEHDLQLEFTNPKFYNLRFKELEHDLGHYLKIWILTKESSKLRKLIIDANFLDFPKEKFKLESFILPTENFIFLTDDNIFGAPILEEKTELDEDFIDNLVPGDYVVHIDHGIGRYAGPVVMDGEKFFKLEYAKGDKLYVPMDKADRLDRYIGSPNPKLHRLSEESWLNAVNKIKENTQQTARELLDVYANREIAEAPIIKSHEHEEKELAESFEHTLTPDQKTCLHDLFQDMKKTAPMDRLICGDVGFGKTEVAVRAAFRAVLNGYQVAVLCPTTILTQQHFDTFSERLKPFGINVEILSRFRTSAQQKKNVEELKEGKIDIIIGTHRLLSNDIKFNHLGLIIIDEEQKFGVKHKEKLKKLRSNAHILTMTATPIPRTLNLALSGLRNISSIRTPPPGRMSIQTIIDRDEDEIIKNAIQAELNRKGQTYFLHNKVETIHFAKDRLQKLLPKANISIAHGQQDPTTLSRAMHDFDTGTTDILVCSTIIENGLDIPNANTLIVEDAPNFGLAQLYQIRGRIGRSYQQAYAYFLYRDQELTDLAKKRLKALKEASALGAGFELAMRDLELRGVGSILGKKQHGHAQEVGLNLYLRLLNQAVNELRQEEK